MDQDVQTPIKEMQFGAYLHIEAMSFLLVFVVQLISSFGYACCMVYTRLQSILVTRERERRRKSLALVNRQTQYKVILSCLFICLSIFVNGNTKTHPSSTTFPFLPFIPISSTRPTVDACICFVIDKAAEIAYPNRRSYSYPT